MKKPATPAEAAAMGVKYYFTGKPCKHGHVTDRLVTSRACVECTAKRVKENRAKNRDSLLERRRQAHAENKEKVNAQQRARYAINREFHIERTREWRTLNKERIARYNKQWRSENKTFIATLNRKWRSENPARASAITAKRRARLLSAVPAWADDFTDFVASEARDLALRRSEATGVKWQVDHAIPLQAEEACGLHVWNNLQVIPAAINNGKKNRMLLTQPLEWIRRI